MKFISAVLALVLLFGCAIFSTKIGEINSDPEKYLGKEITVSGTVTNSLKVGKLSGYVIEDSTGSIKVSSESLPAPGSNVTISGTLVHDSFFGYYILAKN
ncbi:hypothetical protein HY988_04685 [Candidatus Micrarchaeota archaeon]|nr:hypothetical protein [Candidatus Micrarchaeota archaeon]